MLFSKLLNKHRESSKDNSEVHLSSKAQQIFEQTPTIPGLSHNENQISQASLSFLDAVESTLSLNNHLLNEYLLANSEKRESYHSNKFENEVNRTLPHFNIQPSDFFQGLVLHSPGIMNFFQNNNSLLGSIISMVDSTNSNISFLRKSVLDFKTDVERKPEAPQPLLMAANSKKISKQYKNDSPSFRSLFNHLIGTNKGFAYELSLKNKIPKVLNKGKNFVLNIQLLDSVEKKPIKNHNKIILRIGIYTWQIPSTIIKSNKKGNHALTGQHEVELVNGEATFSSLQINEVTSKFINRVVAIMIVPDKPRNQGATLKSTVEIEDDSAIDFLKIKPLLTEKISVKSLKKKYMEKLDE